MYDVKYKSMSLNPESFKIKAQAEEQEGDFDRIVVTGNVGTK